MPPSAPLPSSLSGALPAKPSPLFTFRADAAFLELVHSESGLAWSSWRYRLMKAVDQVAAVVIEHAEKVLIRATSLHPLCVVLAPVAALLVLLCCVGKLITCPLRPCGVILHPCKRLEKHEPTSELSQRILTFNIGLCEWDAVNQFNGLRDSPALRAQVFLRHLAKHYPDADVICLQELFHPVLAAKVAEQLCARGFHVAWQTRGVLGFLVGSGLLIASRQRITNAVFTPFTRSWGAERFALKGVMVVRTAQGLRVGNTHVQDFSGWAVDPATAAAVRRSQLDTVSQAFAERSCSIASSSTSRPFGILCGDFNTSPQQPYFDVFAKWTGEHRLLDVTPGAFEALRSSCVDVFGENYRTLRERISRSPPPVVEAVVSEARTSPQTFQTAHGIVDRVLIQCLAEDRVALLSDCIRPTYSSPLSDEGVLFSDHELVYVALDRPVLLQKG